jgi:hypothetical protein
VINMRVQLRHFVPPIRRQRGVALLIMVMIIALGASWLLVTSLSEHSNRTAADREYNARVLAEAKAALVGWIATNALEATERNPGRLPCPQAWGDVGSSNEGRAAGNCVQPAIGWLPWKTLGLPPMRDAAGEQLWYAISPGWHLPSSGATLTINSESPGQLSLDGQALVALIIAPGRALNVNPDGAQVAAGCVVRSQSRALNLPSTPPDVLDYLECDNASSSDYSYTPNVVDNATNPVLNDQVVAVTTADILPALEAAITKRIEREIVPHLKTLYASSDWGATISLTDPVYPYAATLPTTTYQGVGGVQGIFPANYYAASCGSDPRCSLTFGVAWTATSNTATPSVLPSVTVTGGSGTIDPPYQWGPMASPTDPRWFYARGWYYGQVNIRMTDKVANVANALRTFDVSTTPSPYGQIYYYDGSAWTQVAASPTRGLEGTDGSFKVTVEGSLPDSSGFPLGHGEYYLRFWRPDFLNHPLLSNTGRALGFTAGGSGGVPQIASGATVTGLTSGASGTAVVVKRTGDWATGNAAGDLLFTSVTGAFVSGEDLQVGGTTRAVATGSDVDIGWFARNEWYRVLYYAVAPGQTVASSTCSQTSANCLTLTTDPTPNDRKRALLVLMGRALLNQTRPNAALTNYLETSENRNLDPSFEQPRVTASVNDRVIVIDQN